MQVERHNQVYKGAEFRTTRWSIVLTARDGKSNDADDALANLCRNYWYPLYAFIRRSGKDAEQAKDLTQEFFARLVEKEYLRTVDREKGRFRTFLLTCAKHFLSNEQRKDQTLKRGRSYSFVSFDDALAEQYYSAEPSDLSSPEKAFDRRWAVTLLDKTIEQLRNSYERVGKEKEYEVLQNFLSGSKESSLSYAQAAEDLRLNEAAVRQAALRMRRHYADLLRMEVAQTITSADDVDSELSYLLRVLGD